MDGMEKLELASKTTPEMLLDWIGCRLRSYRPLTDQQILNEIAKTEFSMEKLLARVTQYYIDELDKNFYRYRKHFSVLDPICTVNHEKHRPGFVYVAQVGDLYKIGYTACQRLRPVTARLQSIKRDMGLDDSWSIVHALKTSCAPGLEKYLHHRGFDRVEGEFFKLQAKDLVFIKKLDEFNGKEVEHFETDFSCEAT